MEHTRKTFILKTIGLHFLVLVTIFFSFPVDSFALIPIARTDVVPYQRIEYGESFTFGVVAFSKTGIDRVEFSISGQGYSGGTKISSTMALNTRHAHTESAVPLASWPGVYEYFVTISATEFTSNGTISVMPTVFGNDGGSRILSPTTLIVEGAGAYTHNYAYVNPSTGNDSTCSANTTSRCRTIERAVELAQAVNGGDSSGNIIYLDEGNYTSVGSFSTSTSGEWLSIKNTPGARRDSVIISDGGLVFNSADHLKFEGVSLYADSYGDFVINGTVPDLWVHGCKLYAPSRIYNDPSTGNGGLRPLVGDSNFYATNTYVTEVDRAFSAMSIMRNITIYKISEDVTRNSDLVVNIRVDNVFSENVLAQQPHADAYQQFGGPGNNVIVYNYYGTNLHYQGLFLRGGGTNEAFVNVFMEMRQPAQDGGATGYTLKTGALYVEDGNWDHILFWHCTFTVSDVGSYPKVTAFTWFGLNESGGNSVTNSSLIGNVWREFVGVNGAQGCADPPVFANGNSDGNESKYNHYYASTTDIVAENCCPFSNPSECPYYRSMSPDSESPGTQSHGGLNYPEVLDFTDTSTYVNFGYPDPIAGAILIDRLPNNLTGIPADVFGNLRDSNPDVGAIEKLKSILPPQNLTIGTP